MILCSQVSCSAPGNSEASKEPEASQDKSVNASERNIIPVDLWGSSGDDKAVIETTDNLKDLTVAAKECEPKNFVPVCIVFGGMDESGNVFNDVLLYRLESNTDI